jgi:putative nucleotidyltransferase with HDIG domain
MVNESADKGPFEERVEGTPARRDMREDEVFMSQPRILIVDNQPAMLTLIAQSLLPMQQDWKLEFVSSGAEAMKALEHSRFDVIVTDVLAPELSGNRLLEYVRANHPETLRFLLSDRCDQETILKSVGSVHQILTKSNYRDLQQKLARALSMRSLLEDPALKELVSRIGVLPSVPSVYRQLVELLDSPVSSLEAVGEVIEHDMAMCSKLLQMINSAFFGLENQVSSPARAVSLLGIEIVKALVLSVGITSQLPLHRVPPETIDWLNRHSTRVSRMSQEVARVIGSGTRLLDDSFCAGLLHDVGKLILACECSAECIAISQLADAEKISTWAAERKVIGCTHAEIGAYLLGIWGLPQSIVEAVAWHHQPSASSISQPGPLLAVHVADCVQTGSDPLNPGDRPIIDHTFITRCGLAGRAGLLVDACRGVSLGESL